MCIIQLIVVHIYVYQYYTILLIIDLHLIHNYIFLMCLILLIFLQSITLWQQFWESIKFTICIALEFFVVGDYHLFYYIITLLILASSRYFSVSFIKFNSYMYARHSTVSFWFAKFCSGDFSLENEPRGRPQAKVNNDELKAIVESDTSQTPRELASKFCISIPNILDHLRQIIKRSSC